MATFFRMPINMGNRNRDGSDATANTKIPEVSDNNYTTYTDKSNIKIDLTKLVSQKSTGAFKGTSAGTSNGDFWFDTSDNQWKYISGGSTIAVAAYSNLTDMNGAISGFNVLGRSSNLGVWQDADDITTELLRSGGITLSTTDINIVALSSGTVSSVQRQDYSHIFVKCKGVSSFTVDGTKSYVATKISDDYPKDIVISDENPAYSFLGAIRTDPSKFPSDISMLSIDEKIQLNRYKHQFWFNTEENRWKYRSDSNNNDANPQPSTVSVDDNTKFNNMNNNIVGFKVIGTSTNLGVWANSLAVQLGVEDGDVTLSDAKTNLFAIRDDVNGDTVKSIVKTDLLTDVGIFQHNLTEYTGKSNISEISISFTPISNSVPIEVYQIMVLEQQLWLDSEAFTDITPTSQDRTSGIHEALDGTRTRWKSFATRPKHSIQYTKPIIQGVLDIERNGDTQPLALLRRIKNFAWENPNFVFEYDSEEYDEMVFIAHFENTDFVSPYWSQVKTTGYTLDFVIEEN